MAEMVEGIEWFNKLVKTTLGENRKSELYTLKSDFLAYVMEKMRGLGAWENGMSDEIVR